MHLFDCHNHIQDERLFPMLETVMERAHAAGVAKMAVKGCCEADWTKVAEIINKYPDAYMAFGLHPWFIGGRSGQCFQTLEELLTTYPQASVGEIGIDHAIENRNDAEQERVFLTQLEMARKFDRPVTIHCRRAWGRLIELLDQFGELPRGMLIHCFGGSAEVATELVKRGACISFSGSITRPGNNKAGPAIQAVPDDRIFIETDAPDILPHGLEAHATKRRTGFQPVVSERNHGQDAHATKCRTGILPVDGSKPLNEPANLRLVLDKAAELRGISGESLAQLTFANAERFFNWADHGQDAHATRRTGFQPVGDHGRDAHAT
ncbi:MAG: TatD family hydrolase, partial [Verrucomicrobiota bacterium]